MKKPDKPQKPKKPERFVPPAHEKMMRAKSIWSAEGSNWSEYPPEDYIECFDPKEDAWEQWRAVCLSGGKISLSDLIKKCEGEDFDQVFIRGVMEEDWFGVQVYKEVIVDNPWYSEMKMEESEMLKEYENKIRIYEQRVKEYEEEISTFEERHKEYLKKLRDKIDKELEDL